ncbi:hypothetical protein BSKO_02744 [Bryopsis sp. KO-2023]|nr:hypothetical protein BSKO_02744 [Bryopsis sp. KO-2023]
MRRMTETPGEQGVTSIVKGGMRSSLATDRGAEVRILRRLQFFKSNDFEPGMLDVGLGMRLGIGDMKLQPVDPSEWEEEENNPYTCERLLLMNDRWRKLHNCDPLL